MRAACTSRFGAGLTTAHGRLDGILVAIVPPGQSGCSADADHVHLQVRENGSVYDVAVNVGTGSSSGDVKVKEWDGALADGTWSEGWHSAAPLDYVQLGLHSADFVATPKAALVQKVTDALANANHVSIFATGYGPGGAHLVHRNGGSRDGAVVVRPLSGTPHYLLFDFSAQSF